MSTFAPTPYAEQPLEALYAAAYRNQQLYRRRQAHDPGYALELFHRAVQLEDAQAWQCLFLLYQAQIRSWVIRAAAPDALTDELDSLVNQTFDRLYRRFRGQPKDGKRVFERLDKALAYLKLCAYSAVRDHLQRQNREISNEISLNAVQQTVDLARQGETFQAAFLPRHIHRASEHALLHNDQGEIEQREFWQSILALLPQERERTAVLAFFRYGYDDKEIAAAFPHDFRDAKQVANVRGNALERLRRSAAVRDCFFNAAGDKIR